MKFPLVDIVATGRKIHELRLAKNLKVHDIALFMGFESDQAVYKWQRGESLPTIDNFYALSRLLEVSIDEILQGVKEKDESPSLPFWESVLQAA